MSLLQDVADEVGDRAGGAVVEVDVVGEEREAVAFRDRVPAAAQQEMSRGGFDHCLDVPGVGRRPVLGREELDEPVVER